LYVSPSTNYPTKLPAESTIYNAIGNGNEENSFFWEMVKKTDALKTHIRLRNVRHYYYYIDTNAILSRYIHEINWGLKYWYGEDKQPDIILAPKHTSAIEIANHIVKEEFHAAELITIEKNEIDVDYFAGDEEKFGKKNILIVDASANTGETLIGLLNICKSNKAKSIKICIFLNRLIGNYRHMLESQIDPKNIRSIFRVPIPAFTTTSQKKCPLCNEIKQLKKYYFLMSPAAKEYIDKRLAKIEESEHSNSMSTLGGKTSDRSLKRVKALDYLYGKGSTAFLDALRHSTSLKELWIVLETIPPEYIAMSDIKDWLSKQVPKTFYIRRLTKLIQMWLKVDPEVIIEHIDHITIQFAKANSYKFFSFVFEFLICEQIISLKKVSDLLNGYLRKEKKYRGFFEHLINSAIDKYPEDLQFRPSLHKEFKEVISKAAVSDSNILIEGETGTGKNVLAKCIHTFSNAEKSYVPINVAALPEQLIESELFGHERGAFTGAINRKKGKLEVTDGGTVFLDEIGNIPLEVQAKLLNVLEGEPFERVGGAEKIKPNFRLICATNIPLEKLVREKKFREDLYYRINVIRIKIPPLRETPEDIDVLTMHFIDKYGDKVGKRIEITDEMKKSFKSHPWRGNIRQLKNCIEGATALANNGKVNLEQLISGMESDLPNENYIGVGSYKQQIRGARRKILIHALKKYKGNKSMVAKNLDISRTRVYKSIKELDIKSSDYVIS
jgi:DNA-binding NtrC family response regulator/hypoxanthine phosphoribosyltransferase